MNWDTHEISMIIESDEPYYLKLKEHVEDELYFMVILYVIIDHYNEKNDRHIDTSKVNGNEVYVSFCEACGFETEGWK